MMGIEIYKSLKAYSLVLKFGENLKILERTLKLDLM